MLNPRIAALVLSAAIACALAAFFTPAAVGQSSAATWYVDGSAASSGDGTSPESAFQTIAEGLVQAAPGDTVMVAAGVYTASMSAESVTGLDVPVGVRLIGADPATTLIDGLNQAQSVVTLRRQSALEDFTIAHSCTSTWNCQAVHVANGGVTVRGNHIIDSHVGVIVACSDFSGDCSELTEIAFNQIYDNARDGVRIDSGIETVNVAVYNNTIAYNEIGVGVSEDGTLIHSNLLFFNRHYGIACISGIPEYFHNASWGNDRDVSWRCGPGENNLVQDPFLRFPGQRTSGLRDFRLTAGSPLRRRGVSGADIGAMPFVGAGVPPSGVTGSVLPGRQWQIAWNAVAGARYHVFVGETPGLYEQMHEISTPPTAFRIALSDPAQRLYAAVSTVTADGDESELSAFVQVEIPWLANATIEQDSELVWPSSGWQSVAHAEASGGSYLTSQTRNERLWVPFEGDSVTLGRRLGPDGGYAGVYIDGVWRGWLDYYHPAEGWQTSAVLDGFGAGRHVLELIVSGTKREASTGFEVNLDSMTAPAPFQPSDAQRRAIERVNHYRGLAGLRLARGAQAIHLGAQAHAEFYAQHRNDPRVQGLGFHAEPEELPGFTGRSPTDRARFFGYTGGVGEDGHFLGDPILSVDDWMATVYHRNLIMCYGCVEAGYGVVNRGSNKVDVLNMGSWDYQRPAERTIYTYPADRQVSVHRSWNGAEIPDPLPGLPRPVGYPISLYIAQPGSTIAAGAPEFEQEPWYAAASADGVTVRDAATQQPASPHWLVTTAQLKTVTGEEVPIVMLDQATDVPQFLGPDVVFLVPRRPLRADTTYVAHVAGTDSQDRAFDYRWSFSTGTTLAAPDLAMTQFWSEPMTPQYGETVTFHTRLVNTGAPSRQVTARITLPTGTTLLPGSAAISSGTVVSTNPLVYQVNPGQSH